MGRRGPPPTPTKVLQLRGTFRRDRHGGQEPHTESLKATPRPPEHLNETAQILWRRIAKHLVAADLLTVSDLGAFEGYIVTYARALDAEAVVERDGRTITTPQGMKRHPELVTAERARADMRRYEQLFGLSPSDRARLRIPNEDKPASSPWDEVANG